VDMDARPNFKELAEELSKMARDPPRYIVIDVGGCFHSELRQMCLLDVGKLAYSGLHLGIGTIWLETRQNYNS